MKRRKAILEEAGTGGEKRQKEEYKKDIQREKSRILQEN